MSILFRLLRYSFSKNKPLDSFKHFLQHDAGSSIRQEPHQKDRKYIHVEITQKFKKQEQDRKQLRLQQMKLRKQLLQQKLTTQSKLLTSSQSEELSSLSGEITSLQNLLNSQKKQLQNIDKIMQSTQANMVVVEGYMKLVVLNQIEYLKHMNYHPTGLVLHPQTVAIIENVHYLVNNNLPVNKFKLFQIMPDLFETEIKELDESMRKLIEQKKLNAVSDPSSRIRFFARHTSRFRDPEQDIIDLDEQRQAIFQNMEKDIRKMMEPHMPYVKLIQQGKTPFRSTEHMMLTFLSTSLQLKLTPQEQQLKQTINKISELKDKFQIYSDQIDRKKVQLRHRYVEPPEWIQNHPVLKQRYEKVMVKFMNPTPLEDSLQIPESLDDGGREYLYQRLHKIITEKYHPIIEELWNTGKRDELIANKKKLQINFYNDSTRILEEYNESLLEKKEKQEFLKISKKPRQIAQKKYAQIKLDDLTKAISINNRSPQKYNLNFFTNFLGIQSQEQTKKLFNSFSYLRVKQQQQKQLKNIQFQIIKFKAA